MAKEDMLKMTGEVIEALPNTVFRVDLLTEDGEPIGNKIICHMSGKMRRNQIRITVGDIVEVEMSPYDLTKGRITFRRK